jgi:hypothetical protein
MLFRSNDMSKLLNSAVLSFCVAAASVAFVGCDRSGDTGATAANPGPGERAGQAVDNAARKTGDAAANAGAQIRNGADNAAANARDAANNAGAAARNAADNASASANNAANNVRTSAQDAGNASVHAASDATGNGGNQANSSKLPGLPSVNGTSTSNMSTADAAAQRLIDNARNNIQQNDLSKAKTLVSELKQQSMYDSLSADMKAKVDQLATDVNKGSTAGGATANDK